MEFLRGKDNDHNRSPPYHPTNYPANTVISIAAAFAADDMATFLLSTVPITSHAVVFTGYTTSGHTASGPNNTFVSTSTADLSAARACACP